jgi:hypothetical protein
VEAETPNTTEDAEALQKKRERRAKLKQQFVALKAEVQTYTQQRYVIVISS